MTIHRITTSFFEPKDLGAFVDALRAEPNIELYTNFRDEVPISDDQITRLKLTQLLAGPDVRLRLSTDRPDFSMELLELIAEHAKPTTEVISVASTDPRRDSMTLLFTHTGSIEEVWRYGMYQTIGHAMNIIDH